MVAKYQLRTTLLVGDDRQLHPNVLSSKRNGNYFAKRLDMSLFERLKLGDEKESVLLREQH